LEIRSRILLAFERAEREPDAARRLPWLTFVVIAPAPPASSSPGARWRRSRGTPCAGEFRHFDPRNARVVLWKARPRAAALSAGAVEKARLQLERLGVTVWLGRRVTDVDGPAA